MVLSLVFFFISITSIFLSEVFVDYNRLELSSFIVILTPFFLFLLSKIEKKKIDIPLKETVIYLIFLVFSVFSTFFAIDKEIAIKSLLVYISGYFFFIFSFNHSESLGNYFKKFLIVISIFSCSIFVLNNVFHLSLFKEHISLFYNYGHYQIGNLLVLGLLSIFPKPLSLLFFIFIIFSYSRSANIALMTILAFRLFKNKFNKKILLMGGIILVISLIFIIFKSNYLYQTSNQFVSGRNVYFSYALSSIKEHPLFGIGPGNFVYAVLKNQVNSGEFTYQADNVILQVLSENGILAGIFFIVFILLLLYKHKKGTNFFLFLSLTLMFMSDLSYIFNSFLLLWFILAGLILDSKKKIEINIFFPVIIIFIFTQIILFGQIALKQGLWRQSLFIFPLQKNAYKTAIVENIIHKNKQQANYFLQKYHYFFGESVAILYEIDYYNALGEKSKMITLYERSLLFRTYLNLNIRRAWYFYRDIYGNSRGNEKMAEILKKVKKTYSDKEKSSDFYIIINDFCLKTNIGC
jgi:O-antigen ligase